MADVVTFAAATPLAVASSESPVRYSICSLVTRPAEYQRMLDSFEARGFTADDCEFLYVDNQARNQADAYAGYNLFLRKARGRYVVLCHQDVELVDDDRARLDAVIAELDRVDPEWGLFGNAGAIRFGHLALRITDRYCANGSVNGPFPVRCHTLDEDFIVVRAAANLALPRDRQGFNFYGTELCLMAEVLGWRAYVADFHLRHHGEANKGAEYAREKQQVIDRYQGLMRPRWITTPTTDLFLSSHALANRVFNHHRSYALARRVANAVHRWRRPR